MEQRLSLVSLGVADVAASTAFYERLGWQRHAGASNEQITFFQLGGIILGLYGAEPLSADAGVPFEGPPAFRGVTLAYNGRTKEEVDEVLKLAVESGGKLIKAAEEVFWGGYSGYFADPDGHFWEVAWNPFFPIDADGAISLPE